jgi:hypothetical protein
MLCCTPKVVSGTPQRKKGLSIKTIKYQKIFWLFVQSSKKLQKIDSILGRLNFGNFDCAGKSLSEALIFASTNPQYDDRLFIELQVQYMKIPSSILGRTCCVQKLFLTFRTIFVRNMFSPCSAKKKNFWQRFTCTSPIYKGFISHP